MLELRGLQFSAIGRFVEEQSIDFSSLDEFIQVDGQNNNTKGSSGSGKTTVFNALDYLLGLNDTPSTILQSRFTGEHISVSGDFLWDGKEVSISRSKKLKVKIGNEIVEGSSALAEEKIDLILGMPRKIFRKLLHKRQKEGGFFLDFTPQKMHEFLIDCLDLSEFKNKDKIQEKKISDLLTQKTMKESLLAGQEIGLKTAREAIVSLGPAPIKDMHQDMVLSLKNKMDEAESFLKNILGFYSVESSSLEYQRPNTKVEPFDRFVWDEQLKIKANHEHRLNALFQEEKDRQVKVKEWISINNHAKKRYENAISAAFSAQSESTKVAEEIKKIRSHICPTCEQTWITEQYGKQEKDRLNKLLQLKAIMDEGAQAAQEMIVVDINEEKFKEDLIPKFHPDMPEINSLIADATEKIMEEKNKEREWIDRQNTVNKIENEKFTQKQKEVQTRWDTEINRARGQLDISRRVFDSAVQKLKSYQEASTRHEASLSSLNSKEEVFIESIAEIKESILLISAEIILAEETRKAIKTFLSYSFDDALEAIGYRATEIIRCIPNMSCATIQFDGTKETKDGKVKEEVNAVIGMDGEESVPIKSLSGGERSAVDIAVDLAVIDFIETKSGKGCNIFILDEPFTGLGPVEIEMTLEVLKNSNTNKKIIIVDHNSDVKQMVQNRLLVVRDGLTSRIEKSA